VIWAEWWALQLKAKCGHAVVRLCCQRQVPWRILRFPLSHFVWSIYCHGPKL
jgi:hypothetical protein